jgi:hypothetical protein
VGVGVTGAALLTAVLSAGPALAAGRRGPPPASLTPIIECSVAHGSATRSLFGYQNSGPALALGVGPSNAFSPGPADRGQPTAFGAGTRINVFSVDAPGRVTWTLGGGQARTPGPSCAATPASTTLAGWGSIAAVVIVTAVLGTLLFWRTRRLRTVRV